MSKISSDSKINSNKKLTIRKNSERKCVGEK